MSHVSSFLIPSRLLGPKDTDAQIDRFSNKLACAFCEGLNKEDRIEAKAAGFVDSYSEYIVNKASDCINEGAKQALLCRISDMSPLVAAELLLAINYTGDAERLSSPEFLDNLSMLNKYAASSLLYEASITKNTKALTDERLFTEHAVRFANSIDYEPLSEWYYSIAKTGNISDLTSEQAMSTGVISAIRDDSRISGELSFLIGDSGSVSALTDSKFLEGLKGLEPAVAAEYLSVMWCIDGGVRLANTDTIQKVAAGQADVWKDIARINRNAASDSQRVLISNAGHKHDRGAKLLVRELMSAGYDVIYTGSVSDYRDIARIAQSERASAVGFSIMGITLRQQMKSSRVVNGALREMRVNGSDAVFFAGGVIGRRMSEGFAKEGVSVLHAQGKYEISPDGAANANIASFISGAVSVHTSSVRIAPSFQNDVSGIAAISLAVSSSAINMQYSSATSGTSAGFPAPIMPSQLTSGSSAPPQYPAMYYDAATTGLELPESTCAASYPYEYEMDIYGNVSVKLPLGLRIEYHRQQIPLPLGLRIEYPRQQILYKVPAVKSAGRNMGIAVQHSSADISITVMRQTLSLMQQTSIPLHAEVQGIQTNLPKASLGVSQVWRDIYPLRKMQPHTKGLGHSPQPMKTADNRNEDVQKTRNSAECAIPSFQICHVQTPAIQAGPATVCAGFIIPTKEKAAGYSVRSEISNANLQVQISAVPSYKTAMTMAIKTMQLPGPIVPPPLSAERYRTAHSDNAAKWQQYAAISTIKEYPSTTLGSETCSVCHGASGTEGAAGRQPGAFPASPYVIESENKVILPGKSTAVRLKSIGQNSAANPGPTYVRSTKGRIWIGSAAAKKLQIFNTIFSRRR
ncbi:MAG: hypothetical protein M1569_02305 [Candidatus Marsarchaeota archaeon]|nr:hypothetical protein [Candidatus Marsarchaeota archaeon]MCL5413213.1 hypothetical protein [Candidatus Marsarchaeota archaeon]